MDNLTTVKCLYWNRNIFSYNHSTNTMMSVVRLQVEKMSRLFTRMVGLKQEGLPSWTVLKFGEFEQLMARVEELIAMKPELAQVEMCSSGTDHLNEDGSLSCLECNFYPPGFNPYGQRIPQLMHACPSCMPICQLDRRWLTCWILEMLL